LRNIGVFQYPALLNDEIGTMPKLRKLSSEEVTQMDHSAASSAPAQQTMAERQGSQGFQLRQGEIDNGRVVARTPSGDKYQSARIRNAVEMNTVAIQELVQETKQLNPQKLGRDTFTYIDIASIDREIKQITAAQLLSIETAPSRARKLLQVDDILVSTVRPNLNAVTIVPSIYDGEIGSTGFCVLRARKDILDTRYLYYFTRSDEFISRLMRIATGASYPAVTDDDILETEIPLPPLPEQRRIAAILARADRLRRLRRYALEISASYLQSVFMQMFGDPVTNPMGWDVEKLGSVGTLDRGRSRHRPRNAPELYNGPYPFIQTGDIANSQEYIRIYKQTYSQLGLIQSKLWPKGTLCITIAANIAKTAILTFDACFPDSIVGFTPSSHSATEYVQTWLSLVQKDLEETAPESAQKNINLEILEALSIPLPPLPLQQRFAGIAARHERLRGQQREALRQAELLFDTLLHRAFRGELGAGDGDRMVQAGATSAERDSGVEVEEALVQMGLGLE
jgi:type I restriction enzyme S subunit